MKAGLVVFAAFLCFVSGLYHKVESYKGETSCSGECLNPASSEKMFTVMNLKMEQWNECMRHGGCPDSQYKTQKAKAIPCSDGQAGDFECSNVDLLSFISLSDLGLGKGDANDIWGWTDSRDGKEYAIICVYSGTSFVDISDPVNPVVVGYLKTHTVSSSWRDVKVYKDHAFIISEARNHGMQVIDLQQLKNLDRNTMTELRETTHYGEFGSCHNIVINEETGRAYGVGSGTCSGGLHMIDISNPIQPTFAGCFSDDFYVHDAECVIYDGPDTRYNGQEVCFCYNEDTLTIVDVTESRKPVQIARVPYLGSQYTHQGWLNKDKTHLLMNDELDEVNNPQLGGHTRTMIWDVRDLEAPRYLNQYLSKETAIDHNLYIVGDTAYLANYCAGLRIYDVTEMAEGKVSEIAFFDVSPTCNTASFLGSWSVYPFFESGNLIVSGIETGLFVLRHNPQAVNNSPALFNNNN